MAAQTGQLAIADPVMEMTAGPDQVEPQESAGNNIVEEMDLLQAEFTMGAGPTGGVARGDYSAGQPNQAIGQVEPEELAQAGEEQLAGESETEYILAFGAQISDQEAAGISDPVVYKNDYDSCEINRPIMLFKAAPLKPDEYQTACTQLHDAYRDVMTALKKGPLLAGGIFLGPFLVSDDTYRTRRMELLQQENKAPAQIIKKEQANIQKLSLAIATIRAYYGNTQAANKKVEQKITLINISQNVQKLAQEKIDNNIKRAVQDIERYINTYNGVKDANSKINKIKNSQKDLELNASAQATAPCPESIDQEQPVITELTPPPDEPTGSQAPFDANETSTFAYEQFDETPTPPEVPTGDAAVATVMPLPEPPLSPGTAPQQITSMEIELTTNGSDGAEPNAEEPLIISSISASDVLDNPPLPTIPEETINGVPIDNNIKDTIAPESQFMGVPNRDDTVTNDRIDTTRETLGYREVVRYTRENPPKAIIIRVPISTISSVRRPYSPHHRELIPPPTPAPVIPKPVEFIEPQKSPEVPTG